MLCFHSITTILLLHTINNYFALFWSCWIFFLTKDRLLICLELFPQNDQIFVLQLAYYSCICVPGQARSHLEGCVPIIPAPACLLFLHLRARTSPVTFRGLRAYYSCTCVPAPEKPGHTQRATCLRNHSPTCRISRSTPTVEGYVPGNHCLCAESKVSM